MKKCVTLTAMLERFARPRVIIAHDLPEGIDGLTDGKRIWMRAGLAPRQARSVLAHELVHVERGIDFPTHLEHVEEATVEREAARRSIPLRHLAEALADHGRPCHAAARDLFVDFAALQARMDGLTPFERLTLRGLKLRAKGNTMRKTLTAGFAATALALAACGSADTNPTPTNTATSEANTTPAVNTEPEKIDPAEVGETYTWDCTQSTACEANITVTEITPVTACPYGSYDDGVSAAGKRHILVRGEVETVESANFVQVFDFEQVNSEGFTEPVSAGMCMGAPGPNWNADVRPGEKKQVTDVFEVSENAEKLIVEGLYVFPIPDEAPITPADAGSPSWSSEEVATAPEPAPAPAPAPASSPSTGGEIFGGNYQCPGTDAFVHSSADCTPENLGGEPFTPAPAPTYATSGEAQTAYGCEQGYITDPAQCGY